MFMQPEVYQGKMIELESRTNHTVTTEDGMYAILDMLLREDGDNIELTVHIGYFSRLSAPGYLDCTEWQGPYETEIEALEELWDSYFDQEDDPTLEEFLAEWSDSNE